MSANQLALWYLVAAVSFILALKGLSSRTARTRQRLRHDRHGDRRCWSRWRWSTRTARTSLPILGGMAVGGAIGAVVARRGADDADAGAGRRRCTRWSVSPRCSSPSPRSTIPRPWGSTCRSPSGHKLRAFHRHLHRRDHVLGLGDRVRQALRARSAARRSTFSGQHFVNLAIGIAMIGFGIWFCMRRLRRTGCRSSS